MTPLISPVEWSWSTTGSEDSHAVPVIGHFGGLFSSLHLGSSPALIKLLLDVLTLGIEFREPGFNLFEFLLFGRGLRGPDGFFVMSVHSSSVVRVGASVYYI